MFAGFSAPDKCERIDAGQYGRRLMAKFRHIRYANGSESKYEH
jgi:hypothetical protein